MIETVIISALGDESVNKEHPMKNLKSKNIPIHVNVIHFIGRHENNFRLGSVSRLGYLVVFCGDIGEKAQSHVLKV